MVTEMCVGVMALIAACAMQPGEYFAINMAGNTAAVTAKATAIGYPVTVDQMTQLAASVGERTMIGRTGGAPTFAVGMSQIFSAAFPAFGNKSAIGLWYHFAIMFEALFILTTLDAGTRVGRFLVQDLIAIKWKAFGETHSSVGNVVGSGLFVAAWGWFLYQGVIDPLGGINSLWPIFGIANQLLAVVALAFGTTLLIKMGRARHTWVTLVPLAWLTSVTMSAGWMKLFSADPRLGFLSAAKDFSRTLPLTYDLVQRNALKRQIFNARVDAAVTGIFLVLVIIVVVANAQVWYRLLSGRAKPELQEDPYVAFGAVQASVRLAQDSPTILRPSGESLMNPLG
jgi:carbon starvation protein